MCVAFCAVEHPEHRRFAPVGIRLQQASLGEAISRGKCNTKLKCTKQRGDLGYM